MSAASAPVIWIDAQMSPMVANWLVKNLRVSAYSLRKLKLRDATDVEVFDAARRANAVCC